MPSIIISNLATLNFALHVMQIFSLQGMEVVDDLCCCWLLVSVFIQTPSDQSDLLRVANGLNQIRTTLRGRKFTGTHLY